LVIPKAGITGAAAVTLLLSLATALLSVRDGLRLLEVRYPWPTFCRVLLAMAATVGACLWIRTLGLHVLLELSLGTALYGILIVVLREIRPTQRHLRFVLDWVNFNDKSKL
jgi:O-antigen/teichoic acid export membrane protein